MTKAFVQLWRALCSVCDLIDYFKAVPELKCIFRLCEVNVCVMDSHKKKLDELTFSH